MLASAYRSYTLQKALYKLYVQEQGKAVADTRSARPGYSEHQTGLAVDLEPLDRTCEVQSCFGQTDEGQWLAAHAHTFGFIIRYTEGHEKTTGYMYEPWHIRYVGKDLATKVHAKGNQTLEAFFKLGKAGTY